jgi:hypothetical protein
MLAAVADYLPASIAAGKNSIGSSKGKTCRVRVMSGVYTSYLAAGVGSNRYLAHSSRNDHASIGSGHAAHGLDQQPRRKYQ